MGNRAVLAVQASKLKDYKERLCRANDRWIFEEGDKPLLERDLFTKDSALDKLFSWAKYSTIRKGSAISMV